jgi:triphosphatase
MEVELKLLAAPDDLPRIERHPALGSGASAGRHKESLHTVYFDTPEHALAKAGVALRLRQEGTRWIQTLKGNGEVAAGLHTREELESEVPGKALNLGAFSGTPYQKLLAHGVGERLTPVFETVFERTTRTLAFPEGTTFDLALDRGEIRAQDRLVPISEVELELKIGEPRLLFELARRIAEDVPLRLGHRSKAERGYALASDTAPSPQKARPIPVESSLTACAALGRIGFACIAQMQSNEDGVREGRNPEYLHQLRVGLRRLRSCLGLMQLALGKPAVKPLVDELRWLQQSLGPAREWDVFVTETLAPLAREQRNAPGVAGFRARCGRMRRRHVEAARTAISSQRYTVLLLALGEAFTRDDATVLHAEAPSDGEIETAMRLDAPVREFAAAVLDKRHRKLRKRGEDVPRASPEARHAVRIAAKKLRYAAEFFAPLYSGRRVERYIEALEGLQDILGTLNDAAVTQRLVGEVVAEAKKPVEPYVTGLVQGWTAAVGLRELADYDRAWRRFAKRKRFWR